MKHMWWKSSQYLKKITGVVMIASILVWALGYYPRDIDYSQDYDQQIAKAIASHPENQEKLVNQIVFDKEAERYEKSYIGKVGKFIEPAIAPLGFDWKIGVSLLTGIVVKEIVVSTMGVLYQYYRKSLSLSKYPYHNDTEALSCEQTHTCTHRERGSSVSLSGSVS